MGVCKGRQADMRLSTARAPVPTVDRPRPRRAAAIRMPTALTVGATGDAAEREADRVAERVMRMPARRSAVAVPAVVNKALRAGGEPLSLAARSPIQPRL